MNLSSVSSIALSGMSTAVQRLGGASASIAGMAAQPDIQPEALARDVVAQRVALYEFKANMQTFKTGEEMLGTLLDLHG